jgi:D-lactate dehydrogenase
MRATSYSEFFDRVSRVVPPDRIFTDPVRTLAYGTDASFYRLIPKMVVKVESEDEVRSVLSHARALRTPVTFRAAGTSLSGQSVTDSILVMLGSNWRRSQIGPGAELVTLQPGVIGAHANALLAPHGKKIGPDPASINAAMIGGIAANNASGMCCGTVQNSYRTLAALRMVLADGSVLDTRDDESRRRFAAEREDLVRGLTLLRERIMRNQSVADRIRRKYKMKNTTGYSLNALVDFEDPIDILQHLMIGSEGTLGFLSEITYRTVPELPHKATALMVFPDIGTACAAVIVMRDCPVDAVELMDRASLRSVEDKPGMPGYLASLPGGATALLIDVRGGTGDELRRRQETILAAVSALPRLVPASFTTDSAESALLWNIRKGLFPSVGAMRRTGTTCIIEDVAFPLPKLAEATLELRRLLANHGYADAIIFGHALEGNLHFVFSQDFNVASEVRRYERLMKALAELVVDRYDGSLKAEHGTGRNMAPFVEKEWGAEAYGFMKEIKALCDPEGLLNPGVILNGDPRAHVQSLKPLPEADPIVDKCIECGFCEPHCPSRQLTLSPRQRIVIYRELRRIDRSGSDAGYRQGLESGFDYDFNQTCATDGLCSIACPVGIDTGKLVKKLRHEAHSPAAGDLAAIVGGNMTHVTAGIRTLLNVVNAAEHLLGPSTVRLASAFLHRASFGALPLWNPALPTGRVAPTGFQPAERDHRPTVVYLPTCINRSLGPARDDDTKSLIGATIELLEKGGFRVVVPQDVASLCCGMAFASKGFEEEGARKAKELSDALMKASNGGEYPVYVDMSPCALRMKETLDPALRVFESAEFLADHLAPRLDFHQSDETVALHVTCSSTKMGTGRHVRDLASRCVTRVVVPEGVGCCGWAGDRGFTVPELNASALEHLSEAIPEGCHEGVSTSRTCEIGLSIHAGIPYRSIVYLVDRCTTPRPLRKDLREGASMNIRLAFGKEGLTCNVPEKNLAGVLLQPAMPPVPDPVRALQSTLRSPIGSPPLSDLARSARTACVVICDITRPVPNELILRQVLDTLERNGMERDAITILVATGLHRSSTREERIAMMGDEIAGKYRIVDHDARNSEEQEYLGITHAGTPVYIDRTYAEADLKITTGFIEPHLMAGFSGGRKLVAPGCAGEKTIKALHSPRFLENQECREGSIEHNPLHRELLEIAAIAGHDFIVNVALDEERKITGIFAGDPVRAHEQGVDHVREAVGARIAEPADIVITSSAGFPLDLTFYQAVKGMTAALPVVKKDGVLIIAAECAEGLGSPEFTALATRYRDAAEFMRSIVETPVVIDQWQLEECAKALRHAEVVLVSPKIHREYAGKLFVRTAGTMEEAMAFAFEQRGNDASVAVIPRGPYTLVTAGGHAEASVIA